VEIARGEEFLALDPDTLLRVLACDQLFVDSEEAVFVAAVRWLEADLVRRREFSKRFFIPF
jgi:hypothetical protein